MQQFIEATYYYSTCDDNDVYICIPPLRDMHGQHHNLIVTYSICDDGDNYTTDQEFLICAYDADNNDHGAVLDLDDDAEIEFV